MRLTEILNEQVQMRQKYDLIIDEAVDNFFVDLSTLGLAPLTESTRVNLLKEMEDKLLYYTLLLPVEKIEELKFILEYNLNEGIMDKIQKGIEVTANTMTAAKEKAINSLKGVAKAAWDKLPEGAKKWLKEAGQKVIAIVFEKIQKVINGFAELKAKVGKILLAAGNKICGKSVQESSRTEKFLKMLLTEAVDLNNLPITAKTELDKLLTDQKFKSLPTDEKIIRAIVAVKIGTDEIIHGSYATLITKYIAEKTDPGLSEQLDKDDNFIITYFKENKIRAGVNKLLKEGGNPNTTIEELRPVSTEGERCLCDGKLIKDLQNFIQTNPKVQTIFNKLGLDDGNSRLSKILQASSKSGKSIFTFLFATLAEMYGAGAAAASATGATMSIGSTITTGATLLSGPVIFSLAGMYLLPLILDFIINYGTERQWQPATIKTWQHIRTIVKTIIGAINLYNLIATITNLFGGGLKTAGQYLNDMVGDQGAAAIEQAANTAILSISDGDLKGADLLSSKFGISVEEIMNMDPAAKQTLVDLYHGKAGVAGLNVLSKVEELNLSPEAFAEFSEHAMMAAANPDLILKLNTLENSDKVIEFAMQLSKANQQELLDMLEYGAREETILDFFDETRVEPDEEVLNSIIASATENIVASARKAIENIHEITGISENVLASMNTNNIMHLNYYLTHGASAEQIHEFINDHVHISLSDEDINALVSKAAEVKAEVTKKAAELLKQGIDIDTMSAYLDNLLTPKEILDLDPDIRKELSDFLINGGTEQDAIKILDKAGIVDPEVRQAVIEAGGSMSK